jgi:hypothetical protein
LRPWYLAGLCRVVEDTVEVVKSQWLRGASETRRRGVFVDVTTDEVGLADRKERVARQVQLSDAITRAVEVLSAAYQQQPSSNPGRLEIRILVDPCGPLITTILTLP